MLRKYRLRIDTAALYIPDVASQSCLNETKLRSTESSSSRQPQSIETPAWFVSCAFAEGSHRGLRISASLSPCRPFFPMVAQGIRLAYINAIMHLKEHVLSGTLLKHDSPADCLRRYVLMSGRI